MKRLTDVLGQFLEAHPALRSPPSLGDKTPLVSEQQKSFLIQQLKLASAQNRKIATVLVGVYVAMLVVGFIIALTLFRNETALRAALGGSFLSLLLIVRGLYSVWRENNGMQVLLALIPSLSPEEAIKVVESYYYKTRNAARRSGT